MEVAKNQNGQQNHSDYRKRRTWFINSTKYRAHTCRSKGPRRDDTISD